MRKFVSHTILSSRSFRTEITSCSKLDSQYTQSTATLLQSSSPSCTQRQPNRKGKADFSKSQNTSFIGNWNNAFAWPTSRMREWMFAQWEATEKLFMRTWSRSTLHTFGFRAILRTQHRHWLIVISSQFGLSANLHSLASYVSKTLLLSDAASHSRFASMQLQ